jgi:site-specific DNA-methyltransferase (adenine-specific)
MGGEGKKQTSRCSNRDLQSSTTYKLEVERLKKCKISKPKTGISNDGHKSRKKSSREVAILAASRARLARLTRQSRKERRDLRPWLNKITHGNCLTVLRKLPTNHVDLLLTDPPYGLKYKVAKNNWDDKVPPVRVWKECFRVLKPGAFAFVMSSPRQDVQVQMINNLRKAGFNVNFTSIWYTYKTGFPKVCNVARAIDKKLGVQGKLIGTKRQNGAKFRQTEQAIHNGGYNDPHRTSYQIREPISPEAKAFARAGAMGGFSPKPMLEAVLVAMKPRSEKSYYAQALKNGKGVTFLGKCLIPSNSFPRFPGNLLASGYDAPDEERARSPRQHNDRYVDFDAQNKLSVHDEWKSKAKVEGIFPRCSNLDAWFEAKLKELPENVRRTFPFLIVPKPSQKEKNRGLENMPDVVRSGLPLRDGSNNYVKNEFGDGSWSIRKTRTKNYNPCVKPILLLNYLLSLGTRPNDVVLDCYFGSGTTGIACQMLKRHFIGIEIDRGYCEIAKGRLSVIPNLLMRSGKWRLRFQKNTITKTPSTMNAESGKTPEHQTPIICGQIGRTSMGRSV